MFIFRISQTYVIESYINAHFIDVAYAFWIIKFGRKKSRNFRQATETNANQFWFIDSIQPLTLLSLRPNGFHFGCVWRELEASDLVVISVCPKSRF